jgi:hypothetical protein
MTEISESKRIPCCLLLILVEFTRILLTADALFGDSQCKELSNWILRHRLAGSAAECDGLEDFLYNHTIGNAIHLAPKLHGRARDKLQGQALIVAALHGSPSKRHLHFFKELRPLWLRKTNDQPSEAR